jgi:hypothetical protein
MVPLRSLAAPAAPSTGGTWDRRRQDWASAESSNQTWQWRILHYLSFPATLHLLRWFPTCSRKFSYAFPMKASMSSGDFLATLEDTFIAPALRSFLVFQDRFVRLNDHFMVISCWFHGDIKMGIPWNTRQWKPGGWEIPQLVEESQAPGLWKACAGEWGKLLGGTWGCENPGQQWSTFANEELTQKKWRFDLINLN